ncbi:MAG: DNA primase [Deltaproteobacteria bacterium]|nr:DNA primase [Deltaproteobacteria bacterium]
MIQREKIDELRERASIVEVVGEYVRLTKRGNNHIGLCPFHSEKTPSFSVNEDRKMFYCFGCQAGGNVVTFLMKHENMSFPEAAKALAAKYGVKIEDDRSGQDREIERLVEANKTALAYFAESAVKRPGKSVDYLGGRGYSYKTLDEFRVGYAPDEWEGLVNFLKQRKIDLDMAAAAGLVVKKDSRFYDRFRGRVMFPITDSSGRVVAFGGRSIDGQEPKYLNSPESRVFRKGSTLYAFYKAKKEMSDKDFAVVVEGYFDVVAMHKAGFVNAVATMGTAITAEHLRKLKQYVSGVYALFDSDEAGKKAALRTMELSLTEEMPVKVVRLGDAKDPDEFVKGKGKEGLLVAIDSAIPIVEFFLDTLKEKYDITSASGKAAFLDEAVPVLSKVANVAERGHYAFKVSSLLGADLGGVHAAVDSYREKGVVSMPLQKGSKKASNLVEATILKVVIRHPNLYTDDVRRASALFKDDFLKNVAITVADAIESGVYEAAAIIDSVEDDEARGYIAAAALDEGKGFVEDPEKMLKDSLRNIFAVGRPKPHTEGLLKMLEEGGHSDVVKDALRRIGKGGSVT